MEVKYCVAITRSIRTLSDPRHTDTRERSQRHAVALPGDALAGDQWPVTTISGARPGPFVFINGGIHGGEYPGIETVIRLSTTLDPHDPRRYGRPDAGRQSAGVSQAQHVRQPD